MEGEWGGSCIMTDHGSNSITREKRGVRCPYVVDLPGGGGHVGEREKGELCVHT